MMTMKPGENKNLPKMYQKVKLLYRSSRPGVFCEKGVLRNFEKLTGKHLCQSLFLSKVAALRPAALLKQNTLTKVFSCEFCEISRNSFS